MSPWFLFYLAGHFRLASRPLRRLLLIRSAQPGRRSGDPTVRFPPFLSLPLLTRCYLVRSMSLPLSPYRSCMAGHVTMTTCYHNWTSTLLGAVRHATGRHSYEHNAEPHHTQTHSHTHARTQTRTHTPCGISPSQLYAYTRYCIFLSKPVHIYALFNTEGPQDKSILMFLINLVFRVGNRTTGAPGAP